MHLRIVTYAILLGTSVLAAAQVQAPEVSRRAIKCACSGIAGNTRSACRSSGGDFNEGGCGFSGCCLYAGNEQTNFIEFCQALGFGFRRCDDCHAC
ncbi:hypothetical protein N7541_011142 [Penicillium brevicompactum]|uniref:Uncharacterized protein n=1 Tax=Penicillium brevicompactum TaxID=5074 RepID=A0A9W9UI46_PENBR|nr:hypothetical protein N7452_005920 [Penicillium brevicompactum]KAJ5342018.1 hypothetical protein N7541_011142 [Penicillium brevicompactum]